MTTADTLNKLCYELGITLYFKSSFHKANRTSVSPRGVGMDEGLRILQEVKEQFGLPVLTVEGHPSSILPELSEVAGIEARPNLVDGLAADEAPQPLGVAGIGILAVFQDVEAVVEALLQLRLDGQVGGCGVAQGQSRQVVSAHVSLKAPVAQSPVLERGVLGQPAVILARGHVVESGLTDEGGHQAVGIVREQEPVVYHHCVFQQSVEQCHLAQVEVLRIELRLGFHAQRCNEHCKQE